MRRKAPSKAAPVAEPLAQRAYAKRRGVSGEAVSKAIAEGRLRDSIVMVDGRAKIADPELADREWEANTRPRSDEPRAALPRDLPEYYVFRSQREGSAARRESAQADLAELELARKRGQLIDADDARADVLAAYSLVKTRLLGVPSLVAQRLPHLAGEVEPVVDELIRAALEELSAGDGGGRDE